MSNSDHTTDKDFVMSDEHENDKTADENDDETYEPGSDSLRQTLAMLFVFAGVGVLVIVILSIIVLFKIQNLAEKKQLLTLESKLEEIERSLAGFEEIEKQWGVSGTPEKQSGLLAERINTLESSVTSKIDQVLKELERLRLSSAQQKTPKPETTQPPKTGKKEIKPHVHKVQAGETIYRISLRYGLTVEQLRNYNKLGPNTKIYPGQELKLAP
jgi:hypothetical protein